MADDIDLANDIAEIYISDAIRTARARQVAEPSDGICKTCGTTIEPERLHANPAALMCSDCAIEAEANKRRAQRTGG